MSNDSNSKSDTVNGCWYCMNNNKKWRRIIASWKSQRSFSVAVKRNTQSRRSVKNAASGVGQILKSSRLTHDVPIERVFVKRV